MNKPLEKLISAARKAHGKTLEAATSEASSCEAPLGFGTRVAASWLKVQPDVGILFERWAWRGLAFALVICAVTAIAQETIASSKPYPSPEVMVQPGGDLF